MTFSESLVAFRFGFGLPLPDAAPSSPDDMLDALNGPDEMAARFAIPGYDWVHERVSDVARNKQAARQDPVLQTRLDSVVALMEATGLMSMRATIARALDGHDGLRERLVAFWADHFTVGAGGREDAIAPYAFVEDAIRPYITVRFGDMLTAVVRHPAMLRYLDQTRSVGPNSKRAKRQGGGLNENFARELLELHTMGVGAGYAQDDVRQLALLLAGLTYDDRRGFSFDGRMAEPGPKTVLGKVYDGKAGAPIHAFLQDLALHPDTARHICQKLAVHFLADTPDERVVTAMAQVWKASGGDLMQVYGALLNHPLTASTPAHKARQPMEFLVAALRGLGVTGAQVMAWPDARLRQAMILPLRAMGQAWKSPPGPDGWPEETESWITPQGLAERISWAMNWPTEFVPSLPYPPDFARKVLGNRASPATLWACERAENLAEGVGIVLASPEFNRR